MATYTSIMIQNNENFKEIMHTMLETNFIQPNERTILEEYVDQETFPLTIMSIMDIHKKKGNLIGIKSLKELMGTSKLDLSNFTFSPQPPQIDQVLPFLLLYLNPYHSNSVYSIYFVYVGIS